MFGAPNPAFTASYSGFKNGQPLPTSGVTGAPSLTTSATSASAVGKYAIVAAQGALAATNYSFKLVSGTLTIVKAFTATALASDLNPAGKRGFAAEDALPRPDPGQFEDCARLDDHLHVAGRAE